MKEKKEWKYSKIFFFPQPHRYSWLYSIMSFRERNKIQAEGGGSGLIESIFYWRCASYTDGNITDFSPSLLSPLFQFCLKPDSWDVFWKLCAFHSLPSSSFPVSISAFLYSKVYRCLIVPNVNTVLLTSLTSLLHLNQPCCCSAAKLMKFIAFSKLKKKKKWQGRHLQASFWGCLQLCSHWNANRGNSHILTLPAIHISAEENTFTKELGRLHLQAGAAEHLQLLTRSIWARGTRTEHTVLPHWLAGMQKMK